VPRLDGAVSLADLVNSKATVPAPPAFRATITQPTPPSPTPTPKDLKNLASDRPDP
jgi:hypothetical protein